MTRKNIDPIFKQILQDALTREGVQVETEMEVARLPRTIDGIVTVTDQAVLPELAAETPFSWFKQFNIIAFKGANDPLTEQDYHLIWGRSYLAIGEKDIPARRATLTIICGRTPRNELTRLRTDSTLIERSAGVYEIGVYQPRCYLVVINELPPSDERYAILYLFTSSKKRFQDYVQDILTEQRFDVVNLAGLVHPQWMKEMIMINPDLIPKENYEQWQEWVIDDLIPTVPEELVVKKLSVKARLVGLNPEERLTGLGPKQRLAGLTPEQLAELRELLMSDEMDDAAE